MDSQRVAMIVSQPANIIPVFGMLQRWKPHVLILNHAADNGSQERAIRSALRSIGLAARPTRFEIRESESFARVLVGDFAFHATIADRISEWLRAVRPDVVLGEAYEASSFHRDVGRLLVDDSIQRLRNLRRRIENYEFPLSCRLTQPGAPVQFQVFPFGAFRELQLNEKEAAAKNELLAKTGLADPIAASLDVEPYREVLADRDYTVPPPGLALLYDESGQEAVTAGRYAEAITFRDHFVPLVRALGLGPVAKAA